MLHTAYNSKFLFTGKTVVLHINGPILGDTQLLDAVLEDVSILHLLGVQVVLIAGVRELLDIRIQQDPSRTSDFYQDMRITDARTLTDLKELSGLARFEIESSLAKSYSGKPGKSGINVISGNFFYSGKPVGVRDGIDFKFTGEVRKVEVENLNQRLEQGDVVLLTSLAYSPSGEVFNVPSEMLAAEVAAQMAATKLIYWTEGQTVLDQRSDKPQQSLQLRQAEALLERLKAETNTTISKGGIPPGSVANFRRTLEMYSS